MRVIVTGASKGIGAGIVSVLANEGFTLGLLARSENLLRQQKDSIQHTGGQCAIAACDLRDAQATEQAITQLIHVMDGIDALINNAGLVIRKDVFTLSIEEWQAMMETNVNGLFYATRAVLPIMRKQQNGHIINISSISGHVPLPGGSGYAASKYAVTGFSESLFQEVRGNGIRVTTVFPGSVASESHRHDPSEDHSWKVTPEEVGIVCRDILRMPSATVISALEIRPLNRPPKS